LFKDAKICSHKLDAPIIRSVKKLSELYCPSETELGGIMDSLLRSVFELRDSKVDLEFENGHVFDLGSKKLEVIHTPGHSAGHCCFLIPSEKLIFLADIDLSSFGPWYGALDCDVDRFIESIQKLKEIEFEIAVSSHKGIVCGHETIKEKLDGFLNKIFEREKKLMEFLDKERTVDEIVSQAIVYRKFPEPKAVYESFERIMIEKHLERLVKKNLILCMKGKFLRIS
jgi:glyoxylase-like metal-dependent hydrolase (beta-lactamase superfamily II)